MLNANARNCFYLSLILLLGLASGNALAKGQTTRVSVTSDGTQGTVGFAGLYQQISADGRYVAFLSWDNLVGGGVFANLSNIFVHDRLTKQTTRVSVATGGVPGNNDSYYPSISADGRYVAFTSVASNLVAGDTNNAWDIFVHDRLTKQTTRVSLATGGEQGNAASTKPNLSADGRYVAFMSDANNLVAGDTNNAWDIFVHDRLTKQTTRVSVPTGGGQADFGVDSEDFPSISADGRYVTFKTIASNLVAGDTNNNSDVFVHDSLTQQTTRVSVATNGTQANKSSFSPGLSADGHYVAFCSHANNLVGGDTNKQPDVFIHDRLTHQTTRVSVGPNGEQSNGISGILLAVGLSANGRYVAFPSYASNLVAGDTNFQIDAFIHDRLTKQTTRVSVATGGEQAHGGSYGNSISADGRYLGFDSWAGNLIAGDTNNEYDVFIRDRYFFPDNPTDLKITVTTKPASLAVNGLGSYTYTLTNVGLFPVFPHLTHLVSNGIVTAFANSQGTSCQRQPNTGPCGCQRYALISLCNLDVLQPSTSMTLTLTVKAVRNLLHQQLTLSSYGRDDPVKANNYLSLDTPVTP